MELDKTQIAVIGAGIGGLCTAKHLAAQGCKIALYDPSGFPADNASALAGGMLAPYSEAEYLSRPWLEAAQESVALWPHLVPATESGFTQNGSLFIAHKEDHHCLERFRAHLPADLQGLQEVAPLEPQLARAFPRGLFLPNEAHLHPAATLKALVTALQDFGATLIQDSTTPQELTASYDAVIDARGLGARDDLPALRAVKGETVILKNEEFTLKRPLRLMHPRYPLYIVPRPDHEFMLGATVIESGEQNDTSVRSAMELLSAAYSLHPSFGEASIVDIRAGLRPAMPDNLPLIRREGPVIRLNGMFRHGFLLAPLMADIVKHIVEDKAHKFAHLLTRELHEDTAERTTGGAGAAGGY